MGDVVFLLDVDNTLLDNDRIVSDLDEHLRSMFGDESRDRYWTIFEALLVELGYADYLGALQRYRLTALNDPELLEMSSFLVDYPFADRLYVGALDVIEHLRAWGPTVILTDGDVVFQPRKTQRSGLWDAVEGRVLIYLHKEQMLKEIESRYPARHYVMVDDKLRILAAMKRTWGDRLTTVFPRQGHYAFDSDIIDKYPPADVTVEHIGDLVNCDLPTLLGVAEAVCAERDINQRSHLAPCETLAIDRVSAFSATCTRIGIAADHGGFELKQQLVKSLREVGYEVMDFGNHQLNADDDYPDYVVPLARALANKEVTRGMAICGSGVGACIVANKVSGVRACLIHEKFSAHQGVEDDNMNMMCLGGRVIEMEFAWDLVTTFLDAQFIGGVRHRRRLAKVAELESEKDRTVKPC